MKVVKSGQCIMGIVGTPTPITDLMGKSLFVGDLVMLFYFDGDCETNHGLTYVADNNFTTFSDGKVSCTGVSEPFVMGVKEVALGEARECGGYWHVKKIKRYNIKQRKSLLTPHTIEEIEGVESFFRKDF